MIKNKAKIVMLALIAAFAFALLSYAQDQPATQQGPGMGGADNLKKILNITPEQEAKLKALREARQKDVQAFRERMNKLQTELRDLRKDPKADQKKVDGLIDEIYKMRATREKDMFRNRIEMNKIFTPEQLEKMKLARGRLGARWGLMGRRMPNAAGRFMGRGGFGLGLWMGGARGRFFGPGRPGMMLRRRFGNRMRWRW